MEMFQVGGCVRDEILGIKSKDIDYSVVLSPDEIVPRRAKSGKMIEQTPFEIMEQELKRRGFRIYQSKPEYLTIRAKFPNYNTAPPGLIRLGPSGQYADFVLARKEGSYSDGRRPDSVEVGTLQDDLARRDFTVNAIAKDVNGNLIDPFNGQQDIADRVIRAVGNAEDRLMEDALRGLRAIRFAVQKGFVIDPEVQTVLGSLKFKQALISVSTDRQREELEKSFSVDTFKTLRLLSTFGLDGVIFNNTGLRLMPTMKG